MGSKTASADPIKLLPPSWTELGTAQRKAQRVWSRVALALATFTVGRAQGKAAPDGTLDSARCWGSARHAGSAGRDWRCDALSRPWATRLVSANYRHRIDLVVLHVGIVV